MPKRNKETVRQNRRERNNKKPLSKFKKILMATSPSVQSETPSKIETMEVVGRVADRINGGLILWTTGKNPKRIYLPFKILNKSHRDTKVEKGDLLRLLVFKNQHGLKATEILEKLP